MAELGLFKPNWKQAAEPEPETEPGSITSHSLLLIEQWLHAGCHGDRAAASSRSSVIRVPLRLNQLIIPGFSSDPTGSSSRIEPDHMADPRSGDLL